MISLLAIVFACSSGKAPGDTQDGSPADATGIDTHGEDTVGFDSDTDVDSATSGSDDTSESTGSDTVFDSGIHLDDTASDTSGDTDDTTGGTLDTSDTGVKSDDTGGGITPDHDEGNVGTGQYIKIAANWAATYAITTEGELDCWGDCDASDFVGGPFVDVCAGGGHGCALAEDGGFNCWAVLDEYEVGETPIDLVATALACGEGHTCVVTEDGSPYCWGVSDGVDDYGQVADTRTDLTSVVDVTAGYYHSCALTETGEVYCWGSDYAGESDDMEGPYQSVAAGDFATCGILEDNTAECWGSNATFYNKTLTGHEFSLFDGSASDLFCGVQTSGELFCWRGFAAAGFPNEGGDYIDVSAGLSHWCAIDADGYAHCWGESSYGADIPP